MNTTNITTATLDIEAPDGRFSGYFAAPAGAKTSPVPAVLVLQEIFGVNSHIRAVVERLAQAGFAALAHDVFWRAQPGVELDYTSDAVDRGRELKAQTDTDQAVADMQAAMAALAQRRECRGQKLGVVGFCYGGLLAYLAASRLNPDCVSSYYGGGIADHLDEADQLHCPLQLHFGDRDSAIPQEQVALIKKATAGQPAVEAFVYPGAGHGFHCDQRGSYHPASAEQAWRRTLDLFNTHLR